MNFLLALSILVLAQSQHDHAQHLDIKFIRGETRRIAWLKMEEILGTIENYTEGLRVIEGKWNDIFGDYDPREREHLDQMYDEHFAPKYWDTYDRIFMLSQVCFELFKDVRCSIAVDLWDNKYDRRGHAFHEEFITEVRSTVSEEVKTIKAARKDL